MKRFIRYLYEYQNGARVQNVGFVKVDEAVNSSVLQIYGKGFPASVSQRLEIFLFYLKEDKCIGIPLGEIVAMRPMTAYQMKYDGEPSKLEGIILRGSSQGKMRWYAAVWNEMAVDVERMILESELEHVAKAAGAEEEPAVGQNSSEMTARAQARKQPVDQSPSEMPERVHVQWPVGTNLPEQRNLTHENVKSTESLGMEAGKQEVCAQSLGNIARKDMEAPKCVGQNRENAGDFAQPQEGVGQNCENEANLAQPQEQVESGNITRRENSQQHQVYKITRKDLVNLPRQEWKLANNHFLMHGCRNFHHLISFEKDGECWLGVPGIYHQQEQRAAQAFGFGQFMKPDEGEIILSEDERTEHGDFGYWCRTVNNVIKG